MTLTKTNTHSGTDAGPLEELVALVALTVDEAELCLGGVSEIHPVQVVTETHSSILAAAIRFTHCCVIGACRETQRITESMKSHSKQQL